MAPSQLMEAGFWGWLESYSGAVTALATVVLVAVTTAYVVLTRRLVEENREARALTTRPTLSIYARVHDPYVDVVFLVVENLGPGPARDVRFTLNRDVEIRPNWKLSEVGIFKQGVSFMPPGWRQELLLFFTSGKGVEEFGPPLEVVAVFRDLNEQTREAVFVVDLVELDRIGRLGRPPLYDIAESVGRLQRDLGHVVARNKLHVVTHTPEEMRAGSQRLRLLLKMQQKLNEDEVDEVLRLLDDPLQLASVLEAAKRERGVEPEG